MQVPPEYRGREQSLLKHRVLEEYITGWGHKLGSVGRSRRVRLCYVDGFAGPWNSASENLEDTSIAIGLRALEAAAKTWADLGTPIDIEAAFVEKNDTAFADLERFVNARRGSVRATPYHGEFGDFVPRLNQWMGRDAGLIFVDPTGWKGAAMRFIKPLVADRPRRDVLVNVMFDHINRFKDDPRAWLRDQMREFFGLGAADLPEALPEEQLFALYRTKLKEVCGLDLAADVAIPHPTDDRTKFRLVVGAKNAAALELFRIIEKKVIGAEAAGIRSDAATRKTEGRTGQLGLANMAPASDALYESLHDRGLRNAPAALLRELEGASPRAFGALWPRLLEEHHITKTELAQAAWRMFKAGELEIENAKSRERTVNDAHLLKACT